MNNTMIDDDQNGTPITELKQHLNDIGYVPQQMNQMQQLQQIQQMQQMQQMKKIQQMQQLQQLQQLQQMQQMQQRNDYTTECSEDNKQSDITHLVSDINKSLDNYSPSNQDIPPDNLVEDDDNEENDEHNYNTDDKFNFSIPNWLKEFAIILIIYIVLSQKFIQDFIGKYIKYINPRDDGTVSFIGIVIYGIILAVLYILIKKLFV